MSISMAVSKFSSSVAVAIAAATMSTFHNRSYADSSYRFNPFSSSSPSSSSQEGQASDESSEPVEPKTSGFDPELLERGAKALRQINNSRYAKEVFALMRNQEKTRLAELEAEKAHFEAIQARMDIDRQRKLAEERSNLVQQQSQVKAQAMRYEDELARKRMQTDHENQRRHNVDLVRKQEESSRRTFQMKQATEEHKQALQRETDRVNAEIERKNIVEKTMAEAEARAREAKLTEEVNRRELVERMNGEKEKWLAAINTTFSHIEGGFRILLTDRTKLIVLVGGVTALAAGVYTTREGARVTWGYINRILGQPTLIRESSIARFPFSGVVSQARDKLRKHLTAAGAPISAKSKYGFSNIVLHPSLEKRIDHLAKATANTKLHQAPFRNMLFYGPPGTGKTMVAREIARKSGLDYAMMTGGDVAPLGAQAVTKIHQIFDWSKKSRKGLLLFIDEADAFLCERNSTYMSEAQRSALNALLFRTGDQSRDMVLVLATNRPRDLDSAIADRIDEMIEFPIPGEEERFKLLKLYLSKYLSDKENDKSMLKSLFNKKPQKITVKDLPDDVIREAAKKTDGFSGREIAKLMASVQATVYGSSDCALDSQMFMEVVDYKVAEHHQRIRLATEGGQPANIGN